MLTTKQLLYGKDLTERVVSIEIEDTDVVVYQEDISGKILKHKRPYQSFLLAATKLDFGFEPLDGSLHFKFMKECSQSSQYKNIRANYRDAWGMMTERESYLVLTGMTYYKNMIFEDVSVLSFDIETIGLLSEEKKEVLAISSVFRKKGIIEKKVFSLDEFETEDKMIESWVEWVNEKDPSVITGYNIYVFDLPYLSESMAKFNKTIDLGRNGSSMWFRNEEYNPEKFKPDNSQYIEFYPAFIYGREIVDGYFLAKKHDVGKNYPNYKLKNVIEYEGLIQEGRQFYEADKIRDNWKIDSEREKIKKYCIDDAIDALAVYDLCAPAFFYNAPFVPRPFHEIVNKSTGSQVNNILLRAYLSEGSSIPRAHYNTDFEGAISFGNTGVYKNILKVDVESMYPSIIRHYKIYDDEKDPEAYLLQIVEFFTVERLKNKDKARRLNDKHFASLEQSQKLMINSIFGMLGTKGLLFNSPEKASNITYHGRKILKKAIKWAEDKELRIANADTDSISFCFKDERDITIEIQDNLISQLNENYPQLIKWENDGYFKGMLVLKAKNYALYDGNKLILKGATLRASSKEIALKELSLRMVNKILGISEEIISVESMYSEYVNEIKNLTKIDRWAIRKTMSDKILKSERTTEKKLFSAVEGEQLTQGEMFFVYYDNKDDLKLTKEFSGDHNENKMYEKAYSTIQAFSEVIDVSKCLNYKLKRNKEILSNI